MERTIFILDEWDSSNRQLRPWDQLVPGARRLTACKDLDYAFVETLPPEPWVLIIHRSFLIAHWQPSEALKQWHDKWPDSVFVVVSGSQQTEGEFVTQRVYYRRAPVNPGKDNINDDFKLRFADFLRCLEEHNTVEFSLLEPRFLAHLHGLLLLLKLFSFCRSNQPRDPRFSDVASRMLLWSWWRKRAMQLETSADYLSEEWKRCGGGDPSELTSFVRSLKDDQKSQVSPEDLNKLRIELSVALDVL